MTNEACQATCGKLGFPFAGTEYYGECYCSKTFNGDNGIQKTADCNTPCSGDASQMCGGPARIAAFGFGDAKGPTPISTVVTTATSSTGLATATSPSVPMGWKYMGCYTDLVDGVRTFNLGLGDEVQGGAGNMTNAGCQVACLERGFKYCGTEYSKECFGSSSIGGDNKLAAEDDCSFVCSGGPGEKCGGSYRLSAWEYGPISSDDTTTIPVPSTTTVPVVTPSPSPTKANAPQWKSLGCYFDGKGGRAFPAGHADEVPGGSTNMTNAGCTATCERLGFKLAGTEYSGECWCGQETQGDNGPAPLEDCNMPCFGNTGESCGAGNRLTAWQLVEVIAPESTTTGTTSVSSTETVSESTPTLPPTTTSATELPPTESTSDSTTVSTSTEAANSTSSSSEASSSTSTISTSASEVSAT